MNKRTMGNTGEDAACKFLEDKGFSIVSRNYQKKWGELDIVAEKDKLIHFFEVKSVSSSVWDKIADAHTPEENVHALKVRKIRRMVETYLAFTGRGLDTEFQFHILCVYLVPSTDKSSGPEIRWVKNVIL